MKFITGAKFVAVNFEQSVVVAYALFTKKGENHMAASSWMNFVLNTKLNVGRKPMMKIRLLELVKCVFICEVKFLTLLDIQLYIGFLWKVNRYLTQYFQ